MENTLKTLRKKKGWSPEKLAAESCVSLSTIHRLESGNGATNTKIRTLIKIANALDVKVWKLWQGLVK